MTRSRRVCYYHYCYHAAVLVCFGMYCYCCVLLYRSDRWSECMICIFTAERVNLQQWTGITGSYRSSGEIFLGDPLLIGLDWIGCSSHFISYVGVSIWYDFNEAKRRPRQEWLGSPFAPWVLLLLLLLLLLCLANWLPCAVHVTCDPRQATQEFFSS